MINLKNVIDLSVPLMAGIESDPEPQRPQIYYSDHKSGLRQMMEIFPGTKEKDFPVLRMGILLRHRKLRRNLREFIIGYIVEILY